MRSRPARLARATRAPPGPGSAAPPQSCASQGRAAFPLVRRRRRAGPGDVFDATESKRGPAGLMARADATTGLTVEVLMKQHQILPVRISGVARIAAVARAVPVGPPQKDGREPPLDFPRGPLEREHPARAHRA